jgi:simple sugar transport system permease protein
VKIVSDEPDTASGATDAADSERPDPPVAPGADPSPAEESRPVRTDGGEAVAADPTETEGPLGRLSGRLIIVLSAVGAFTLLGLASVAFPDSIADTLFGIVTRETWFASALRRSVPIALAALGGIFAEKSGVINIGLEGLLIISAFAGVYVTFLTGSVLVGFVLGVVASVLLAILFALVCIAFRADQIIAGLAVWLVALGLAPFASQVVFGSPNTPTVSSPPNLGELLGSIPVVGGAVPALVAALDSIPVIGGHLAVIFDASLTVHLMLLAVVVSWYLLNRTAFGRHVRASGENPEALDTAGVNVSRVRYAAVIISGVLSGMGGAALALDLGQFTGNGPTMVNGRGFIAIVAYLFGNYNPIGAFLSTFLFGGLDALQVNLQIVDVGVPDSLVRTIPFVTVIIVLALVGRTRIPEAAGEHYSSGEE